MTKAHRKDQNWYLFHHWRLKSFSPMVLVVYVFFIFVVQQVAAVTECMGGKINLCAYYSSMKNVKLTFKLSRKCNFLKKFPQFLTFTVIHVPLRLIIEEHFCFEILTWRQIAM